MRHLVDHRKLGRAVSHRKALLRNLTTSLILHERIETTLPKAKELRRVADQMITLGKENTLHARRRAAAYLLDPEAVQKLFNGLSARFKDRSGGYTRIFHYGFRRGDSAEMAAIEYLGYVPPAPVKKGDKKAEKKPEKKAAKKSEKKFKKEAAQKAPKKTAEKKSRWGLFGGGGGRKASKD